MVGQSSVGSGSNLGRRLKVGYGPSNSASYVLLCFRVVGGGILIKLVPVVGLAGRYDLFCSISRFLVFIIVIVYVLILYRVQLVFDINTKPRFVIGVAC